MPDRRIRTALRSAILWLAVLLPAPVAAQVPATCAAGPTEPARWLVPRVEHHNVTGQFYGNSYCETTILVTNLTTRTALVQVDFESSGHQCIQDEIAAGNSLAFGTAPMTPIQNVFFPAGWDGPGTVVGRANVHANVRDVSVSVYLVCRDAPISSPGNVIAMTALSAIQLR